MIDDVSFALAPIGGRAALALVDRLITERRLAGSPETREQIARVVVAVGEIVSADARLRSIEINPLALVDGEPMALDAGVVLER